jgi:hypothetical protein
VSKEPGWRHDSRKALLVRQCGLLAQRWRRASSGSILKKAFEGSTVRAELITIFGSSDGSVEFFRPVGTVNRSLEVRLVIAVPSAERFIAGVFEHEFEFRGFDVTVAVSDVHLSAVARADVA